MVEDVSEISHTSRELGERSTFSIVNRNFIGSGDVIVRPLNVDSCQQELKCLIATRNGMIGNCQKYILLISQIYLLLFSRFPPETENNKFRGHLNFFHISKSWLVMKL